MAAYKLTHGKLAVAIVGLTLLSVGVTSRYAVLTVLVDGLRAAIVMVPPALAGLWLVPRLNRESRVRRPRAAMPLRWHLLLGSALGIGGVSILVLLLGLLGLLHRPLWIALLSIFTIAGVIRLRLLLTGPLRVPLPRETSDAWRFLWLLVCPPAVLALLAASSAPGFIRQEEGFGYDVLEYHLQLPKEYHQAGRIEYVPHNVYANFPADIEMLYLLAMVIHDDVRDIGVTANMMHLFFAVLAVFAAWTAGREWSPAAGTVCAVSMATAGWLCYLCGLAYVENGMLFFGMASAALLLRRGVSTAGTDAACADALPVGQETQSDALPAPRFARPENVKTVDRRSLGLAGILAGFACGCKYTAVPLIAMPLALAALLAAGRPSRKAVTDVLVFVAAASAAFAPWLVKNQVMTGNPVFPLANSLFRASPPGWGAVETEHWDRGHGAQSQRRTLKGRFAAGWQNILADRDQRFGPAVLAVALVGLFGRRRNRIDLVLAVVLIAQVGIWLFATHLFARFAVVLLMPLALLCGRSVTGGRGKAGTGIIVGAVAAGCAWNTFFGVRLFREEAAGGAPASLFYDGQVPGFEYLRTINHELPADARILLVGDAKAFYFQRDVDYCVAFNRNPFFVAARTGSAQELLRWLRRRGYSHVLVNWSEVRRLASTYGFSPSIDPVGLEETFSALSAAGLSRIRAFPDPRDGGRYVDLYRVPR